LLVGAVEHALDLVLTTEGDHFEDDNGSVHEVSINKAGAAGVVTGFDDGTYRVNGEVARDQMASFALGALDLVVSRPGWERAVDLIEDCRVKSASQSHSLVVTLFLKDGGTHTTTEPHREGQLVATGGRPLERTTSISRGPQALQLLGGERRPLGREAAVRFGARGDEGHPQL